MSIRKQNILKDCLWPGAASLECGPAACFLGSPGEEGVGGWKANSGGLP